ncbi:MAG: DUF3365 domain-containing protein [Candidatus Dadabacteria bacterium]|nr:MAG: DUF3365 domain-containing protein [Candidatus Dadabacteria bacterium]
MSRLASRLLLAGFMVALVAGTNTYWTSTKAADADKDPALERTRKTVRMLDDIYKTAVVLITEHYVNDEDDLPAGSAAIALFDAIKKKGWHEVRLLDATGEPYDDDNVAKDRFEKEAVKQLKAGKSWYEQVTKTDNGQRVLRVATPIPVVLKKCTMCHPHYADAKPGEAIGLLSYKIPIE